MKIIRCFIDKWVNGYCRHVCLWCKYKDTCDYECKYTSSKYLEGYDAGYRDANSNYLALKAKISESYYNGYFDGNEGLKYKPPKY